MFILTLVRINYVYYIVITRDNVVYKRVSYISNVRCGRTGQSLRRQKVVILRELYRAIIYTTKMIKQVAKRVT